MLKVVPNILIVQERHAVEFLGHVNARIRIYLTLHQGLVNTSRRSTAGHDRNQSIPVSFFLPSITNDAKNMVFFKNK